MTLCFWREPQKEQVRQELRRYARDEPPRPAPPPELLCPITLTLMADPVTTVDGMTYERYAIETWLQANNTSPLTGEPLPVKLLVPNTALRSQIQRYRERHASPGGSRIDFIRVHASTLEDDEAADGAKPEM